MAGSQKADGGAPDADQQDRFASILVGERSGQGGDEQPHEGRGGVELASHSHRHAQILCHVDQQGADHKNDQQSRE